MGRHTLCFALVVLFVAATGCTTDCPPESDRDASLFCAVMPQESECDPVTEDCPGEVEVRCDDGQDDDGDGDTDCDDSDCAQDDTCSGASEGDVAACTDGQDNDNDGDADCADSDCVAAGCGAGCACIADEAAEVDCADGEDNDRDGRRDCADDDCDGESCGSGCLCNGGLAVEESCDDQLDNDGDQMSDCVDPDCEGAACGAGCSCEGSIARETDCGDGLDNDNDGVSDCDDPDCSGQSCGDGCTCATMETLCGDGADDDGDGDTDCADSDCDTQSCGAGCTCAGGMRTETDCTEGGDNDGDGDADCADEDCADVACGTGCLCSGGLATETLCDDDADNDDDGSSDCADSDCDSLSCGTGCLCTGGAATETLCDDGLDNDGDGNADCEDPDCDTLACGAGCVCATPVAVETVCDDNNDNDDDGASDCADRDCDQMSCGQDCICQFDGEVDCEDGVDNDADNDTDCADSDCNGFSCGTGCICVGGIGTETLCSDTDDNDGDTFSDCEDLDCAGIDACVRASIMVGALTDNMDGTGSVAIDVERVAISPGAETWTYEVVEGTAVDGEQFNETTGPVDFADGATMAGFDIELVANGVYDGDTTVVVRLLDGDGMLILEQTVTIADLDPPPTIGFAMATMTVTEDVGSAMLSVVVTGATSLSTSVDFASADGTARQPDDYGAVSGTLTIPSTSSDMPIVVTIVDDALFEPDQDFRVTLSGPQNATLATATTTVTIDGDPGAPGAEPMPTLDALDTSVSRADGMATVTFQLDVASETPVTFDWATHDNTATAGVDYTASSDSSTIDPGLMSTTGSVPVAAGALTITLGDTDFLVRLTNVVGATQGTDATVTIGDGLMRVIAEEANDSLRMISGNGFGDVNSDGELDWFIGSVRGDGTDADDGVGYVLYGGPDLPGSVVDLATATLDGTTTGFTFDDTWEGRSGAAALGDINGDGIADPVGLEQRGGPLAIFGSSSPAAYYDPGDADGAVGTNLTGSPFNNLAATVLVGDYDGDGFAEVMGGGHNTNINVGPRGWSGRASWPAAVGTDMSMGTGIGTCGVGSQSNFAVLGGVGEFNNDGFLDFTGFNGCGNDGQIIPYRMGIWFGNVSRTLPGSMVSTNGSNGVTLSGGGGRGPGTSTQYGDFDGDGIDDILTFQQTSTSGYVIYGVTGSYPTGALSLISTFTTEGFQFLGNTDSLNGMGAFGDLDGDGYDDLFLHRSTVGLGGVVLWGRPGIAGQFDVDADTEALAITSEPALGGVSSSGVADLDGDGLGDLLIGFSAASPPGRSAAGVGIVIFGSRLASTHNTSLVLGTPSDDVLGPVFAGTSVVAGRGNDSVELPASGVDVAYLGQGDDTVVVAGSAFRRIDGGLGDDTFIYTEADGSLDFRVIGRARVNDFESFDLTDPTAQSLAFNRGDVASMGSHSNELTIDGGAEDTVTLTGATDIEDQWVNEGDTNADGRDEYTVRGLTVHIAQTISVVLDQ